MFPTAPKRAHSALCLDARLQSIQEDRKFVAMIRARTRMIFIGTVPLLFDIPISAPNPPKQAKMTSMIKKIFNNHYPFKYNNYYFEFTVNRTIYSNKSIEIYNLYAFTKGICIKN